MRDKKHTWNHRVLAFKENTGEVYLQVTEVYYTDGVPDSYISSPIDVYGEDISSIEWTLKKMKKCLSEPILWGGDRFPEEYKPKKHES